MSDRELKLVEKQIKREFREIMPKKYYIFPTVPYVYRLSNCICIEMPRCGSEAYNTKLELFKDELNKSFVMDIRYDNNITFILKDKK